MLDRGFVRARGLRGCTGLEAVQDRLVGAADRSRLEVVMRELARVDGQRRELERLGDPAVQPQPSTRDRPLIQRRAHERVAEREAIHLAILDDETRGDRGLEDVDQLILLTVRRDRLQGHQAELVAEHRGQRQRL